MKSLSGILALTLALAAGTAAARTVVIDVRTGIEYAMGHIDGAINISHTDIAKDISKAQVGRDDRVILYCRSGNRSGQAQDTLRKLGFTHVENYGGMDEARKRLQTP